MNNFKQQIEILCNNRLEELNARILEIETEKVAIFKEHQEVLETQTMLKNYTPSVKANSVHVYNTATPDTLVLTTKTRRKQSNSKSRIGMLDSMIGVLSSGKIMTASEIGEKLYKVFNLVSPLAKKKFMSSLSAMLGMYSREGAKNQEFERVIIDKVWHYSLKK